MQDAQTVVLGLGTVGSAALYHLARRGVAAMGVEQYHAAHPFGSSHGHSRGFRTFYHDPLYTAWAEACLPMWQELESLAGERLFTPCGWMAFARPGNPAFQRNLRVMRGATFPYEVLSPAEVAARFPGMRLPSDSLACFTPRAGFLDADRCVRAHLSQAARFGAALREHARVEHIDLGADRPVLETSAGRLRCSRLILTPGPWAPRVLQDLSLPLRVTRQQKFYFRPRNSAPYRPERMPVYVDYDTLFYGFPYHGQGIKVADDNLGDPTDPESVDRELDLGLRDRLRQWLESITPGSELTFVEGATCMYTLTPDSDFIIGPHPHHPNVFIGAGFSGHGFKFSPLVGQILAELAVDGRATQPLERFRPDRFSTPSDSSG